MSRSELKEAIFIILVPIVLCFICVVTARTILPEHCNLFDDNIMPPQMCHTIPMPDDCYFCEDKSKALIASTIGGLGICFFFLPFVIFAVRNLRNRPVEETKLFD